MINNQTAVSTQDASTLSSKTYVMKRFTTRHSAPNTSPMHIKNFTAFKSVSNRHSNGFNFQDSVN